MASQDAITQVESKTKKTGMLSKPYAYLHKIAKNLKLKKNGSKQEIDLLTGPAKTEPELPSIKEEPLVQVTKKKSLLLDLDKTLLITSMEFTKYPSYPVKVRYMGEECIFHVARRPGAYSFVEELSKHYEIFIFTTSLPEYAASMIEFLCIGNFIKKLFHRDHCGRINGTTLFKNIKKCGDTLENIIFIDDSPIQVSHFRANSIHIAAFEGDPHDQELYRLAPFLKAASTIPEVRPIEDKLKAFFAGKSILEESPIYYEKSPVEAYSPVESQVEVTVSRVSRNFVMPKPRQVKLLSHIDRDTRLSETLATTPSTMTPSTACGEKIVFNFKKTHAESNSAYRVATEGDEKHRHDEFEYSETGEYSPSPQVRRIPTLIMNSGVYSI